MLHDLRSVVRTLLTQPGWTAICAPPAVARLSGKLSDRLWRVRFSAAPDIVGHSVRVNGMQALVIGVAPPGFVGATQLVAADLWLPAALYASLSSSPTAETVPMFGVIGRLSSGISVPQATARLNTLARAAFISAAVPQPRLRWSSCRRPPVSACRRPSKGRCFACRPSSI